MGGGRTERGKGAVIQLSTSAYGLGLPTRPVLFAPHRQTYPVNDRWPKCASCGFVGRRHCLGNRGRIYSPDDGHFPFISSKFVRPAFVEFRGLVWPDRPHSSAATVRTFVKYRAVGAGRLFGEWMEETSSQPLAANGSGEMRCAYGGRSAVSVIYSRSLGTRGFWILTLICRVLFSLFEMSGEVGN